MQVFLDSNNILNIFEHIESFTNYNNGKPETIHNTQLKFTNIKNKLYDIFSTSILVPALGVSIHELTVEEIKNDYWLEINFESELNINDLPFTSLLFKLEETGGINLIRKHNNKYDGRCLYLNLEKTTDLISVIS